MDIIYTDFEKKTFDKVRHRALISKLRAYWLEDILVQWIQDFLCHRKQQVGLIGFLVESGIP